MNNILSLLLASFILSCCNSRSSILYINDLSECKTVAFYKQVGNHQVTVCDAKLLKDTVLLPLSFLIEELQVIKLESNKSIYVVGERDVIIGEHYILIQGNMRIDNSGIPVRLFDKSGKFIANIGGYGRGLGEYSNGIKSMQLDENNNRIYLFRHYSDHLLMYDLKGKYLGIIPFPFIFDQCKFYVNWEEGTVMVFTSPNIERERLPNGRSIVCPYCVWIQNISGEVIQSIAPGYYGIGLDEFPSGNSVQSCDISKIQDVFFASASTSRKDTLYHYDQIFNRLIPKFTVDFGEKNIPIHFLGELTHHYIGDIGELEMRPPYGSAVINHINFIVDKTTLKGAYYKLINDYLDNSEIDFPLFRFENSFFTLNWEPDKLLEKIDKALANTKISPEKQKKLSELKKTIDINDNNYILYAKWKN